MHYLISFFCILTTTLCNYTHFTDVESEAQRVSSKTTESGFDSSLLAPDPVVKAKLMVKCDSEKHFICDIFMSLVT